MGGNAFAHDADPLYTPRMPAETYAQVKDRCIRMMGALGFVTDAPLDGPAKPDFGDIDLLATWPDAATRPAVQTWRAEMQRIADALSAHRIKFEHEARSSSGTVSAHLALAWPGDADGARSAHGPRFIQLDVRLCDTVERMRWILFKHAHGDIWGILGSSLRSLGLTADEEALYVRVPEMEAVNKKKSRVWLSADPDAVLAFLGLSSDRYWAAPFDSCDDMYEYVAGNKFFWVRPERDDGWPDRDGWRDPEAEHDSGPEIVDANGDELSRDLRALRANDRARMGKRPVFHGWVADFLPRCRREGRLPDVSPRREDVTAEALERFGARVAFDEKRTEFLRSGESLRLRQSLLEALVPPVADPADAIAVGLRTGLVRVMARILADGDTSHGLVADPSLRGDDGLLIDEQVATFVKENLDRVRTAILERRHSQISNRQRKQEVVNQAENPAGPEPVVEPAAS